MIAAIFSRSCAAVAAWGISTATLQISAALSYSGTIKAFHCHVRQTDIWVPAAGMLQVVSCTTFVAAAPPSPQKHFYIGDLRPSALRIPPGVAHGYKGVGSKPALLVYATDRFYDPAEEGRIPYNDQRINDDWELPHK